MENNCPHCGKPMPKSSAFCMHCMRGIDERDAPPPPKKASKKGILVFCALLLACAIGGSAAFAAAHRSKSKPTTTVAQSVSATEADTTQSAPQTTTTAPAPTTEKQTTQKETSTVAPTTTQATEPPTVAPTTKAPVTTASNQVLISGSVLKDYPNTRRDSSYTIPYSVTSIANNAFHGNPYLTTLKFSKRTNVSCNWSNLFASLPNLEKIYIYTGTTADTQGMQYFDGEIVYYYD